MSEQKDEGDSKLISLPGEALEKAAADVIGKVVGATADGAVSTLGNIFGAVLGDRIKEWRAQNLVRMAAQTAQIIKDNGGDISKSAALPNGQIYAIFDGASREDDDTVSKLWSGLLASAMEGGDNFTWNKRFALTLEGMTPSGTAALLFISYILQMDASFKKTIEKEFPSGVLTGGAMSSQNGQELLKLRRSATEDIEKQYSDMGLLDEGTCRSGIGNLLSLGCIVYNDVIGGFGSDLSSFIRSGNNGRSSEVVNVEKLKHYITQTENRAKINMDEQEQFIPLMSSNISGTAMNFRLTNYGEKICNACKLPIGFIA